MTSGGMWVCVVFRFLKGAVMKLKKRIISTFVTLALMLSVVPLNAGMVSADADTEPPVIDLDSIEVTTSSGSMTVTAGDTVTVSCRITDNRKVDSAYLGYALLPGADFGFSSSLSYTENAEILRATCKITEDTWPGTYRLGNIYASDSSGNRTRYYDESLYPLESNKVNFSAYDITVARTCRVTFISNGGSSVPGQDIIPGEKAVEPSPDPTRAGFEFAGWYKDASYENEYNFNDVVSKDLTLYAKWNTTIGLNSYNATTDEDMSGGKFSVTGSYGENEPTYGWMFATVDEGAEITLKAFPDAGNKFVGWYEGVYVPIYKDGKLYSQTVLPKDIDDPDTIVSTDEEYTFSIDNETMLCAVFEKCTNHEFGEEQIKKATPDENGYIYHICNICGEEETVVPLLKVSNISLDGTSFTYTGKEIKPKVKVANASEELSSDCYTIKYSDNVKVGKATVTVTLKGQYYEGSKTLTFEIKEAPSLKLDKTSANVVCGNSLTLKATLKGVTGKVSWKSSDTKIATVDSNGKVTSKMAGTVTITASASGMSAACKITMLYKDVTSKSDFWYAPTNYLTASGVVKGYANQTEFRPANDCTRAQMVTFLYRLQGEPKTKSNSCKFTDVSNSDYYYKPVIWAVEKGITTGVSSDKFDPKGVCTRAQTVTFLWRMANKPEPKTKVNPFPDVKEKDYYYKATLWASEMKILAGLPDGRFNPKGKCLRRQMVTFLYKYDKFINGKG